MKNNLIKITGLLIFTTGLIACSQNSEESTSQSKETQKMPATEVGVVTVKKESVDLDNKLNGRVVAKNMAEVRPRVTGIIKERKFEEGSLVNEGDVLYTIEPSKYQASYNQAQASLAAIKASSNAAYQKYKRYQQLIKRQSVSQQDFDTVRADYLALKANVAEQEALLNTSEINLGYTEIKAPLTGIIGTSNFTKGALVTENQTEEMATIRVLDPIYVDLNQSLEQFYTLKKSELTEERKNVQILFDSGQKFDSKGKLELSDVFINETTGTVKLRVEVPNKEGVLLPGMYVRALVYNGTVENGFLVPQQGVLRNSQGNPYVLVVDKENNVIEKEIVTGGTQGSYYVVSEGLSDNDKVIVEGSQKATVGSKVSPVSIKLNDPELEKTIKNNTI